MGGKEEVNDKKVEGVGLGMVVEREETGRKKSKSRSPCWKSARDRLSHTVVQSFTNLCFVGIPKYYTILLLHRNISLAQETASPQPIITLPSSCIAFDISSWRPVARGSQL